MQLDTRVYRVARKVPGREQGRVIMNEHVQTATADPLFNPLAPEFIRNPYPHYARLRTMDPVHLNAHGAYVCSRHAEASLVLRDKRFGKEYVERTLRRYGPKAMESRGFPGF